MKLNFLQKIFFFLNLLAIFSLLISYLAPFVSPQEFWLISFLGIAYPLLVFTNFLFFIFWLLQKKWVAVFSLLSITLGYSLLNRFYSFHFDTLATTQSGSPIKLLSYNVRNFNFYNWSSNKEERKKFIDLLKEGLPDIICFQEFYTAETGFFQNIQEIQKELSLPYYAFGKFVTLRKTEHWGWAIFSKYPILDSEKTKFQNSRWNGAIRADIKIGGDTIRFFNLHLQSVHFHKNDYEYIDKLTEEQDADYKPSKKILGKLRAGFKKRAVQVDLMSEKIRSSPYPVIVCGDFNDTPSSYAYEQIQKNLQDAFIEKGFGFGQTYTGYFAPFRIDYILLDKKMKVHKFYTIRKKLSDHFPIVCEFSL